MAFFICNFPPMIVNSVETYGAIAESPIFDYMIQTSNLLVTINSSVNFIIYTLFGEKCKRLFLTLFRRNTLFAVADGTIGNESFVPNVPNVDRQNLRLYRRNTFAGRNSFLARNGSRRDRSNRNRTFKSSFNVYYQPNKKNKEINVYTTQTSIPLT